MITNIILGITVGVLSSGSGLGGGFLVVPFLIYLGKTAKKAVGTSFLYVLLVAISSFTAHYRLGNIDYRTGLVLAAGGILGAQIGPQLLDLIPELTFKFIFGVMMITVGIWLISDSKLG